MNVQVSGGIEVQDDLDILQIMGEAKVHSVGASPECFGLGLAVQPNTAFAQKFSSNTILHQNSHR